MSLPGRWRWCDRPWLCDARKEQNALHTLIHQRHLTPSCGGLAPTAERTMDPARILMESLTPRPELENSQGQSRFLENFSNLSKQTVMSKFANVVTIEVATGAKR